MVEAGSFSLLLFEIKLMKPYCAFGSRGRETESYYRICAFEVRILAAHHYQERNLVVYQRVRTRRRRWRGLVLTSSSTSIVHNVWTMLLSLESVCTFSRSDLPVMLVNLIMIISKLLSTLEEHDTSS